VNNSREQNLNELTEKAIGCAIEVHKQLGPGLLESIYENALCIELDLCKIKYERQKALNAIYKNKNVGDFRVDLVIEEKVVIELKSVERHDSIFEAQILSYMKLGGYKLGLLINFNPKLVTEGVKRFRI